MKNYYVISEGYCNIDSVVETVVQGFLDPSGLMNIRTLSDGKYELSLKQEAHQDD